MKVKYLHAWKYNSYFLKHRSVTFYSHHATGIRDLWLTFSLCLTAYAITWLITAHGILRQSWRQATEWSSGRTGACCTEGLGSKPRVGSPRIFKIGFNQQKLSSLLIACDIKLEGALHSAFYDPGHPWIYRVCSRLPVFSSLISYGDTNTGGCHSRACQFQKCLKLKN